MYGNKLAIAIKVGGKVLREYGDKVYVPFGSEYSLLLKNLNTVRAVVNISIDGQDIVDGGLVLPANMKEPFELERFVKDLNKGHRFKFIERSSKIENHRGIKMEDGLITVEYQFEKRVQITETVHHTTKHIYHDEHVYPSYRGRWPGDYWRSSSSCGGFGGSGMLRNYGSSSSDSSSLSGGNSVIQNSISFNAGSGNSDSSMVRALAAFTAQVAQAAESDPAQVNDVGITVKGSESKQQFQTASWFALSEEKFSMIIHMLGGTGKGKIKEAKTVKTKNICESCGTHNKFDAKFCKECGTSLEVLV